MSAATEAAAPRPRWRPAPGPAAPGARRIALDVLDRTLGRSQTPADEAYAGHDGLASLDRRDRAFARLLVLTVLRRLGELDAVLDRYLERRPALSVRNMLRLGVAQLLILRTPPHAAVGDSAALASGSLAGFRALVNAVLRRVAEQGENALAALDRPRLNTPEWAWLSWVRTYGEPTARAIAEAHLLEPPLDLSARGDPGPLAATLEAEELFGRTLRRPVGGAVEELPGYAEGAWWVQDAAASLPASLLGAVAGRRVLDIGAAPGGKTLQLAAAGAAVTALEISEARAGTLRANLARTRLAAEIVVADARSWRAEQPFAQVLLDAPCSATGTARRHPDVLRHKRPGDVNRLARLQDDLLDAASLLTAGGGTLLYAVCSLEPEEGPERIAAFLARHAGWHREPIAAAELPTPELRTTAGELRTLPCHLAERGGMDGFYAARLRKTG